MKHLRPFAFASLAVAVMSTAALAAPAAGAAETSIGVPSEEHAGYLTTIVDDTRTRLITRSVKVPTLDCSGRPGIDDVLIGLEARDEERIIARAVIALECFHGREKYRIGTYVARKMTDEKKVSPGDKIKITMIIRCHEIGACNVEVTMERPTGEPATDTGDADRVTDVTFGAMPVADPLGDPYPVPKFSRVRLHKNTVNGEWLDDSTRFDLQTGPVIQVSAGEMTDGSFSLKFENH